MQQPALLTKFLDVSAPVVCSHDLALDIYRSGSLTSFDHPAMAVLVIGFRVESILLEARPVDVLRLGKVVLQAKTKEIFMIDMRIFI